MTYLIQCDGKLPNLALMRLSSHFKENGESVTLMRGSGRRSLFDEPGPVYASSIFKFSEPIRQRIRQNFGDGVTFGGTGVRVESSLTEIAIRDWDAVRPDYSIYPDFMPSLDFSERGCRLTCKFCVVPKKEGKPRSVNTIANIWRGKGHPKKIILLDNDFFGQPRDQWQARIAELREGGFRVSFCQGINIRQVDEESATAIASVEYRDNEFQERILYTAWDNLGDEGVFERGVGLLQAAGIPSKHLRVYMLIGFMPNETFEQIYYRFNRLVEMGCQPYPMLYDMTRKDLKAFQRWVITGLYRACSWKDYRDPRKPILQEATP